MGGGGGGLKTGAKKLTPGPVGNLAAENIYLKWDKEKPCLVELINVAYLTTCAFIRST